MKREMKYLLVACFIGLLGISLQAQEVKPRPYLLDSFVDGTLYYATAAPRHAKFNYHLVGQEIVMDFENKKVPVNNFPNLDSVHIGDRNFILLEGKSYEQLIGGPVQLLVDYRYTSQIEPNEGAYGTKSHAAAVVVADQRILPNDFYSMEWNEGYELINRTEYYILESAKLAKFTNANQLGQIFKDKKKELKDFASKNKIEFLDPTQVKELVMFVLKN